MNTKIVENEIRKIREEIKKEFPEDPALQEVHIARKIIAKEAEYAGMSYFEYVKLHRERRVTECT